jgi:hypothetical protein
MLNHNGSAGFAGFSHGNVIPGGNGFAELDAVFG